MAVARSLVVNIQARTATFDANMRRARGHITNFGRAASTAKIAVGAFLGTLASRIVPKLLASLKQLPDEIDRLSTVAARMQLPIAKLQALQHAANMADVDVAAFQTSLIRMMRNLGTVSTLPLMLRDSLKHLGVEATMLKRMSIDQAFLTIVDAINAIPNPMERASITMEIFGRSGQQMINMIAGGSQKIRSVMAEVKRFGAEISSSMEEAASAYDDATKRIGLAWEGLKRKLGAPIVGQAADIMEDLGFAPKRTELEEALARMQRLQREEERGFLRYLSPEKWPKWTLPYQAAEQALRELQRATERYYGILRQHEQEAAMSNFLGLGKRGPTWTDQFKQIANVAEQVWSRVATAGKTAMATIWEYVARIPKAMQVAASVERWRKLQAWVEQMVEAIKTPADILAEQMQMLQNAMRNSLISGGQFERIRAYLVEQYGPSPIDKQTGGMGIELRHPREAITNPWGSKSMEQTAMQQLLQLKAINYNTQQGRAVIRE